MKYSELLTRPVVMGTNGMVAAGHPLASQAAVRVLQDGGNAVDAAVTAAWVLAVVKPESCGVGGDVFLLSYDADSERLESLNGSGRAPAAASLEDYRDGIPTIGARSTAVPGAVRGWTDALARYGTMSLADTLAPAIRYADRGFPVSVRLSAIMRRKAEDLRRCPAAARVYLKDGCAYEPGELLRLPDLARSLTAIAHEGPEAFYRGGLAETIVQSHQQAGGLLTLDDLGRQESIVGPPLSISYRGYQVCVQSPVSMGMLLLQQLKIAEGFELDRLPWDSAERVHLLVEAKRLSFADLEAYVSDPAFTDIPVRELLSSEYAAQRRAALVRTRVPEGYAPGATATMGEHTTYLAVVDQRGNAVSWIQTLFGFFGSCWMAPGTGILLTNRLTGFSTDPNHVNRLEGGKRTAHTLLAPMVLEGSRPCLVLGTPGDYGQTQSNLQMITNFVDYGMDVQAMIEAPRWRSMSRRTLAIESRYRPETLDDLAGRGYDLDVREPWTDLMGGAQAIRINRRSGCLEGGADPRREGYAIGW